MEKELKIPIMKKPQQTSPLNVLHSFCSKRSIPKPLYILTDMVGKGNVKFYEFRVKVGSIQLVGNGQSLKKARQRGAENMLNKLRALGEELHKEVHKKVDLYESYFIDNYDFKQTLGSGGFGVVMEAEKKITKTRVAVKRVKLPTNKEENEKTLREVQLLAKLGTHHNIVGFNHTWIEEPPIGWQEEQDKVHGFNDNSQTISFLDDDDDDEDFDTNVSIGLSLTYLYMELELCRKESLRDWLDKNKNINRYEEDKVRFFIQMLQGVSYIHEKGVIHRDLKPSNILFAIEGVGTWIKIGDFGLATAHQNRSILPDLKALQLESSNPEQAKSSTHTMEVGTRLYMSPEQKDNGKYNHKVDIWALGLIFIELYFVLDNPRDRYEVLTEAKNGNIKNFKGKDVAKLMLDHNPGKRPEAKDVLQMIRPPMNIRIEVRHEVTSGPNQELVDNARARQPSGYKKNKPKTK